MSSLASAPRRDGPGPSQVSPGARGPVDPAARPRLDLLLAAAIALALAVVAFLTGGGTGLAGQTWVEIALVAFGAACAAAAIVAGRGATAGAGGASCALLALLTALTAGSIAWSVAPDRSWLAAAQTLAYLAVFGGGVLLARLAPSRWAALVGGIALLALVLSGWAVIVKVFSLDLEQQTQYGRLLAPFEYWNATGLMAAMGLGPLLWAGSRRAGPAIARALTVPGVMLLITVVVLSYSRSAILAAAGAVLVALAGSSRRLRATGLLAVGAAGAAAVSIWALGDHALSTDQVSRAARSSSGHALGLAMVIALLLTAAAGYGAVLRADRHPLSAEARRRAERALLAAVALIPVAAVIAAAASSRGLTGEVSHVWSALTSTSGTVGDKPGRIVTLANSRPRYWHQAISVGEHHLLAGAGAGSFGVAHLRYPSALLTRADVTHAHSYVLETFADLGLIGLAVNLALLIAWGAEIRAPLRRLGPGHERDGAYALLAAVIAFGISSAVDWTWSFAGVAVPALLCAGWLAGWRGVGPPGSRTPQTSTGAIKGADTTRPLAARPLAILGLTALLAGTLAGAYAIWQPLRSADAASAAIAAAAGGQGAVALADARAAARYDPVSVPPLLELSAIYSALGRPQLAVAELVKATSVQPQNPATWKALGEFALAEHHPRLALRALRRAATLDVTDTQIPGELSAARAELPRR